MHHRSSLLTIILLEHNSHICPNIIFQAASSLGMKKPTAAVLVTALFQQSFMRPFLPHFYLESPAAPEESGPVWISPSRFGTTATIPGGEHTTLWKNDKPLV